ncbi:MAG: response regulator [Deltaproteobacteria bacterium]|uniref:Response regulator n=1 Tax=Candidatus Zymogenus saltonus TaxID=2844893 RepID=A0A9D8KFF9_9DELT|nr:response regulator [Candidatus Zymogenus saltonus]
MKILIVDDEPTIRDYLEEVFKEMGHEVASVSDGYDAIDYVREHDVNLAYVDVKMPGIDGFETFKRLREIDPKIGGVMISGNAVEKMMDTSIQRGVYVCLKKPMSIDKLEEINKAYENIRIPLEFVYKKKGLSEDEISGAKILIADDEEGIRKIIQDVLNESGFSNIDMAENGQEAIDKFNEKRHDTIILDIKMPIVHGVDVLRHVKALSPDSEVIIISGAADKDSAIAAVKLGAYDYIEKPFEVDTLLRIISRAVEKRLLNRLKENQ